MWPQRIGRRPTPSQACPENSTGKLNGLLNTAALPLRIYDQYDLEGGSQFCDNGPVKGHLLPRQRPNPARVWLTHPWSHATKLHNNIDGIDCLTGEIRRAAFSAWATCVQQSGRDALRPGQRHCADNFASLRTFTRAESGDL